LVENNSRFCIRGGTESLVGGRGEGLNKEISEDSILELEDLILEDLILFALI
jgi:hypothetical protein